MATTTPGRRLRVLQVVHVYHPVVAGSELLFRKIAEGLAARGIDVSIFTSTARSATELMTSDAKSLPEGVETVHGVRVRRFPHRQFSPWALHGLGGMCGLWSNLGLPGYGMLKAILVGPHMPGLVDSVVAWHPDIIAATAAPCLPIFRAAAAARRANTPIVIMPCLHSDHRWFMDNPALLQLLRTADGVMALTPYEINVLRALDVRSDRLWLIGGGVAADAAKSARVGLRAQLGIARSEPIVLFFGRKEPAKGISDVLEAMVRLWQQDRPGVLVLAGASTQYSRTQLAGRIAELRPEWQQRVLVRDDLDEDEKWGWYSECDVFAHPSRDESFGLVYLEAWLCGKPVIGGRTGPQCCVIDEGVDGLLVRPGDVDELVDALGRVLFEPGLAGKLGRVGQAKVLSRFTWDSVVDRAEEMYRFLASRNTRASH